MPLILFYVLRDDPDLPRCRRDHGAQPGARGAVPGAVLLYRRRRIWMLLEAEFLAIVLVLVYVGAVMVLFLFVVMMLDIDIEELRDGFDALRLARLDHRRRDRARDRRRGADAQAGHRCDARRGAAAGRLQQYPGARCCCSTRRYVYPFEIAAVLLLVAIVAAIALTLRHRTDCKVQDIGRAGGGARQRAGAHRSRWTRSTRR